MAACAFSLALAVDEEFHLVGIRHHIYRLSCAVVVVPVSDDMSAWLFGFNPSVPHHLMNVESVLRQSHGIHHATGAEV